MKRPTGRGFEFVGDGWFPTAMAVPTCIEVVLEPAGLSTLLWSDTFRGQTSKGRKVKIHEIIARGW